MKEKNRDSVIAAAHAEQENGTEANRPVLRTRERIWELDALRGFAVVIMLIDFALSFFCILVNLVWQDSADAVRMSQEILSFRRSSVGHALRMVFCAVIFIVVSGINTVHSRHNVKRGLECLALGTMLSLAGYVVRYFTGYDLAVRFGILQFFGFALLTGELLKPLKVSWLLAIGTMTVVLGYLNGHVVFDDNTILPIFNFATRNPPPLDTYPIVPYIGYYFYGMALGKVFYRERKTLLPRVRRESFRVLCALGAKSFSIYTVTMFLGMSVLWILSGFAA